MSEELDKEWKRRDWVSNLRQKWTSGGVDKKVLRSLSKNYVPGNGSLMDNLMNANFESVVSVQENNKPDRPNENSD